MTVGRRCLALVESNTTGSGAQFVAAAASRGLHPVLISADPTRYAFAADPVLGHVRADTRDPADVLAACRRLVGSGLGGITSSSEYFVATAAAAAARLGLPGPDAEAIRRCRNKGRQRAALAAAAVPVPEFRCVSSREAALDGAHEVGWPVVVKPIAGSGSLGVRSCTDPDEVEAAAVAALTSPASLDAWGRRVALVEHRVDGAEYSVETFDGDVVGVTAKRLGPLPHFLEVGHEFPAPVTPDVHAALADAALGALRALGLGWGAAHTELRWSSEGPVVIEVNPRLAGGMIPRLVQEAIGIDLVDCSVARASGEPVEMRTRPGRAAAIRFVVAPRAGFVRHIDGVAEAAGLPGVRTVEISLRPGVEIADITGSFRDRVGHVIATASDPGSAAERADAALARLVLSVEPRGDAALGRVPESTAL